MIDSIYKLIQVISNKEYRGHISPSDYNLLGKNAQNQIFRGYFEDIDRDKLKVKRGASSRGYSNRPMFERERMDVFSKVASLSHNGTNFVLPSDLYLMKDRGLTYNGKIIRESENHLIAATNNSIAAPSTTFPMYYNEGGGLLTVAPSTITSSVSLRYFRKPLDPKWTYTTVAGVEMYNPSAGDHQDFELHESEYYNLVIHILSQLGINLSDRELAQYAEAMKQKQDIKEEQ